MVSAKIELVVDTETNGLLDKLDTVWCIVAKNIVSGEVHKFYEDTIDQFKELFDRASLLIGHSIIKFDLPALEKVFGWKPNKKTEIFDTHIASMLDNPDRALPLNYPGKSGPHSLDAWGFKLGRYKPSHDDWDKFSPEMLHRCTEDMEINHIVYDQLKFLRTEQPLPLWIELNTARIMGEQERRGVPFDKALAIKYICELTGEIFDLDSQLNRNIPLVPLPPSKVKYLCKNPYTKTGAYSATCIRQAGWKIIACPEWIPKAGDTLVDKTAIDLGSPKQVCDYLLSCGWKPTEWNLKKVTYNESRNPDCSYFGQQVGKPARDEQGNPVKASPKLTEDSFTENLGEVPTLMLKRRVRAHRRSQIASWISATRDDMTIPQGANTCGTNTRRMRHITVVNVPRACSDKQTHELIWDTSKQSKFYGTQMRSLFYAPGDWVMCGYDAKALEARVEAHYTYPYDGGAYAKELLEGDPHTKNSNAWSVDRDTAKSGKYAVTYGCSKSKLAQTLGKPVEEASFAFDAFWEANPSLAAFREDCIKEWELNDQKWIKGLDGSKIPCRSKHALVNTKFQSGGAILMKLALVLLDEKAKKARIKGYKVIDMHDEGQWLCHPKHAAKLTELMVQSVVSAGEMLNLNIPLAADTRIGKNWAETH